MSVHIPNLPHGDMPLVEQFRLASQDWIAADDKARELDDTKTAALAQMVDNHVLDYSARHGSTLPHNRAEREVRASDAWHEHLIKCVLAKTEARRLGQQLKYIEMKERSRLATNAMSRSEMYLGQGAT